MQAKLPPYDTGKVKIGLLYQPRQENEYSTDQVLLQKALLGDKDSDQVDLILAIVYAAILVIVCGGLLHANS
jgi:Tfp pilus assembly protein PilF